MSRDYPRSIDCGGVAVELRRFLPADEAAVLAFAQALPQHDLLFINRDITHPRVIGGYPTEKPVAVSEVLVRQSTSPGALVIDPFMGSGSVGVAATGLGRHFAGNDLCREAVDTAGRRLGEAGARRDECRYDAARR